MKEENNLDELTKKHDRLNYLLDAITGNSKKFDELPEKLQKLLKPYKDKIENGESLTKEDFKNLKDNI